MPLEKLGRQMQPNSNAIICRSIHQEIDGSFILVGVLSGALQTNGPNIKDEFCLFWNLSGISEGDHNIELRLVSPDGSVNVNNVTINIPDANLGASIQFQQIPFETTVSGDFRFDWRLEGAKAWKTLVRVPVAVSVKLAETE